MEQLSSSRHPIVSLLEMPIIAILEVDLARGLILMIEAPVYGLSVDHG